MARILHVLSDWKWTGPAEPTANLCCALRDRGHDVWLACQPTPDYAKQSIEWKANERGVYMLVSMGLDPSLVPRGLLRDAKALRDLVERDAVDLVHTHFDHDMMLARLALGGRRKRQTPVVRSYHKAAPPGPLLMALHTWAADGVVTVSRAQRERFVRAFPRDAVSQSFGAIDLARFTPRTPTERGRELLGVDAGNVVVGIVARVQRHRRFDLFLDAMAMATQEVSGLKGVVVGRGTHRQTVAIEPARRMGLDDRVFFPGYISGEDYLEAIAAIDIKAFLVPGSDGSCRAARELMAMGKPVVATNRQPLPEIVGHEIHGLVVDESPSALARAIVRLAKSPDLRQAMGQQARRKAERAFSSEQDLAAVESVYGALLA